MKWAYLAFEQYENELLDEIRFHHSKETARYGRLFFLNEKLPLNWAQLSIENPQILNFSSIKEASDFLKNKNLFWGNASSDFHRRSELIREKLGVRKIKPAQLAQNFTKRNYGFWYLLDDKSLMYSEKTGYPFPITEIQMQELTEPPSRAYMKLWELFTLHLTPPEKNARVLDLGACPGGWTWVLLQLGCQVTSVDKAPLDPQLKGYTYLKKDAFKLLPQDTEKPDWFFSDIICEPRRLFELVQNWLKVFPDIKMVCTIKYKGKTDFETTEMFRKIPGSRFIHLNCNKHEITWIRLPS